MYILPIPELRLDEITKRFILDYVREDLVDDRHWWRRGSREEPEDTRAYWHLVRPEEKIFQELKSAFILDDRDFLNLNVTIEIHKFQPRKELKSHKDICRNSVIIYPLLNYEGSTFHFYDGPRDDCAKLFSIKYSDTPLLIDSDKWHGMTHDSDEERISIMYSFHKEYDYEKVAELYYDRRLLHCQREYEYLFPSEEPDSYGDYDDRKSPYPESF